MVVVFSLPQSVIPLSRHACSASSTVRLASSISSSDSFTYTKPLDTISGPATSSPLALSRLITTIIIPSSARCCLSLSTTFPTSPTPRPSTRIAPTGTLPLTFACSSLTSSTSPEDRMKILSLLMPRFSAIFACAFRCLYSPWTGTAYFGWIRV